jgi:hypothetical protein
MQTMMEKIIEQNENLASEIKEMKLQAASAK